MNKIWILLIVMGMSMYAAHAQQAKPFAKEIQAFKKQDSIQMPPKNAILFVGGSSIVGWRNAQQHFPQHTIINRGFGGSSLPHVINYANDVIFPYNAKQIVIYVGENDFTAHDSISAQIVFNRFQQLFHTIRARQPKTPIVFISIKPSPSRAHLMPKFVEANSMIEAFLKKQKRAEYVDVYSKMLDENGKPMEDIFQGDRLHMNEKGYAIWQEALKPYLKK